MEQRHCPAYGLLIQSCHNKVVPGVICGHAAHMKKGLDMLEPGGGIALPELRQLTAAAASIECRSVWEMARSLMMMMLKLARLLVLTIFTIGVTNVPNDKETHLDFNM